jgi:hypothetical protein
MPRSALEVADIFRSHGAAWRKANAGHVSLGQLKAMAAIEACRTAELGGHVARCEDCAHTVISYNSCVMCTSSNGELTCLLPHFPVHRRAFTLHYEARRSNASSLSVGWNVPRRRCGGTIASIASSFSAGSPRV